ncbi:Fe-S cluster assembly protein SufD [Donghicola mangrovi]|uniref:Fe-S cluster assembly protein SufD n=1 Tax=Donghicola mangrovi TaxID=2729614 RepID=A0A850Q483_9RHOB|nr:Fe-S cluster assembly protein SufD [Donghicola mangrovi]NVO23763.1 Fe-S cluster assembly protein SufD [Donghicola mangrovi]
MAIKRAQLKQQKQDALAARQPALSMPEGGEWITAARKDAAGRLDAMGLPIRRDEYWKYTRPDAFTSAEPVAAALAEDAGTQVFEGVDVLTVVFRDGAFDADASDALALDGVEISRLADAAQADIHWAKDIYGALETAGQDPVERPLAALNTAYATDGLVIRATGAAAKPIHVVYERSSDTSDVVLHHVIKVEEGASVTLLETGAAGARANTVTEVTVADTAAFHHVRSQGRDQERQLLTHMFARLGSESTFKSFTLTPNGKMTRNECILELTGDDAIAHVAGALMADGKDVHQDDTIFITHDAVNCESRQVFKKVLSNGATGVFQGKILVKQGAQKTDGYQISQSLLLDEDSQFLAKPELEIYADDVACSHGSTSGAIDEDALYYLRARGVPKRKAQDLMVLAFLAEAVDEIESEELREAILRRIRAWLDLEDDL